MGTSNYSDEFKRDAVHPPSDAAIGMSRRVHVWCSQVVARSAPISAVDKPLMAKSATSRSDGVRPHSANRSCNRSMKAPDARRSRSSARPRSRKARRSISPPTMTPRISPTAAPISISSRISQLIGAVRTPNTDDRMSDTKKKAHTV